MVFRHTRHEIVRLSLAQSRPPIRSAARLR